MPAFEVPLVPTPQTFRISLVGVVYTFTFTWCKPMGVWVLAIGDASNSPIVGGVPLVTGADLLGQLAYLGIGGSLVVQTTGDALATPTFTNLGSQGLLFFVTPPTAVAA
jgi:hypothetical protein